MPKPLLIIQNVTREGPGILGELLEEHRIPSKTVDLEHGDSFPDPTAFGALVVMGGPQSANDETEMMKMELQRAREAIAASVPYLGVCLGLQVLVKAAGGRVVKSPLREVGFRDPDGNPFTVALTDEGKCDPLFNDVDKELPVFHLHGETVELTSDMTLLGTAPHVPNQIVRVGENAYGIQCHFELTEAMFEDWITTDNWLKELNPIELRHQCDAIEGAYTETGRKLLTNFLQIATLLPAWSGTAPSASTPTPSTRRSAG